MNKKNKDNIMTEALYRYDKYLSKSDTEDILLHKSFKEKLSHIEPKQSLVKKIKSKINLATSVFGSSLFITGFLIARLTLPTSIGYKGIEDNSYIDNLPTKIIEVRSIEEFNTIMADAITKEISFEFESNQNFKQLYIRQLHKYSNPEFKKVLKLNPSYEGPLTIILK